MLFCLFSVVSLLKLHPNSWVSPIAASVSEDDHDPLDDHEDFDNIDLSRKDFKRG